MNEANKIKEILRPLSLMILIVFLYTNIVSPTYAKYVTNFNDSFALTITPEELKLPNVKLNANMKIYLNGHSELRHLNASGSVWDNLNDEEQNPSVVTPSGTNGGWGTNCFTFGDEHVGGTASSTASYIRFDGNNYDTNGSFTTEGTLVVKPISALAAGAAQPRRSRHYLWSNTDGGGYGLEINYISNGDRFRYIGWIGDDQHTASSSYNTVKALPMFESGFSNFSVVMTDYFDAGDVHTVSLRYDKATGYAEIIVLNAAGENIAGNGVDGKTNPVKLGGNYKPTGKNSDLAIGAEPQGSVMDPYSAKFDLYTFRMYNECVEDTQLGYNWYYDQKNNYKNYTPPRTSTTYRNLYVRYAPTIEVENHNTIAIYWQMHPFGTWKNLGTSNAFVETTIWPGEQVGTQVKTYRNTTSPNILSTTPTTLSYNKITPTYDFSVSAVSFLSPMMMMSRRPAAAAIPIDVSGLSNIFVPEMEMVETYGGWPSDSDVILTLMPEDGYEIPSEIAVTLGEDLYRVDTNGEQQYRYVYFDPAYNELWIDKAAFPTDGSSIKISDSELDRADENPAPTVTPTAEPSAEPSETAAPSATPSAAPSAEPTVAPTVSPTANPMEAPEPSSSATPGEDEKSEEKTVTLNLNDVSNVTLEDENGNVLANGVAALADDGSLTVSLHTEDDYELPESFSIYISGTEYTVNTDGENNPDGIDFNPVTKELTVSGDLLDGGDVEISFSIDAVVKPTKEEDGEDPGAEGDGNNTSGTGGSSGEGDDSSSETPTEPEDNGSEGGESGSDENLPGEGTPDALPEEGENTEGDGTGENTEGSEGDSSVEGSNGEEPGDGEDNTDSVPDDTPAEGTPDATPDEGNKDDSGDAEVGDAESGSGDASTEDGSESLPAGEAEDSNAESPEAGSGDSGNETPESNESAESGNTDSGTDVGSTDPGSGNSSNVDSGAESGNETVSEAPAVVSLNAVNPSQVENEK